MPSVTHRHLPRLSTESYRGYQFVHWSMTIADRKTGWLNADFHRSFRAILAVTALDYRVVVPAYCLMPDHFHLVAAGVSSDADQKLWARASRRAINGILAPIPLQKQAYDHVLRPAESGRDAFATLLHYVCANPVRAGLAPHAHDWPFTGSLVPALPALDPRDSDFPETWWAYWNSPALDRR